MLTPKTPKTKKKFVCLKCDFVCCKQSDYNRHLSTQKHINLNNANIKANENTPVQKIFTCVNCENLFKHISSLSRHKKKCNITAATIKVNDNINENIIIHDSSNNIVELLIKENTDFKTMIMDLVKSNTKLQEQMIEVCKNNQASTINNNNTTNNTTNNKTFNLQFFLNEQCKDAMNLKDFVNSFQLNLDDLERVGQQGYIDGIAHIIIKKIKETDLHKRPFHCSDAKRETLYVKDDNVWEKEGTENLKMVKAVKDVGQKNFNVLNDYRVLHPDCLHSESDYNDKYIKLMIQAVGSQKENVNKVIKKIAKEVVIEKE